MSPHSSPLLAIRSAPCGCELPIPAELEDLIPPDHKLALSKIRLKFAQDVSRLTAAALDEVAKLVQEHC
jgi:hypothetical protein